MCWFRRITRIGAVPGDCAEFMSWLVFPEAGILYGCFESDADPALVEAYTGAWKTDSANRGRRIPVDGEVGPQTARALEVEL